MRAIVAFSLFAGMFAIAGCGETGTETAAAPLAEAENTVATAVNEVCPIMGGEVIETGGRSDWQGQTVGFCCPGCIKKWEGLSDNDKTAKLAASMKADGKTAATGSCCSGTAIAAKTTGSCCDAGAAAKTTGSCCSAATVATSSAAKSCCSASTAVAGTEFKCPMKCTSGVKEAGKCKVCSMELVEAGVAVTAINTKCPIMGGAVKAGGGTAEWNGKTVGFCCPGCVGKWDALSEEEKTQKLPNASGTEKTGA